MTTITQGGQHQITNSVYRLLLESSMAGFWDWHIPSNQEYLSPRFKNMFGYEDHELPNAPESWQKLIFEEDLNYIFERFDEHVNSKGKIPFEGKVRYRHKNGSTVHVNCQGMVIEWDKDGTPIRAVGTHIDITELENNKRELQLRNELNELILKGSHAGIWDWAIESGNEWWSPKFYDLLGYKPSDLVPSYDFWINKLVHPADKALVENAISDHLSSKKPYRLEIRMRHNTLGFRWFETTGQAVWNENNEATRMAGSIIDITERVQAKERADHQAFLLNETGKMAKIGGWEVNLENNSVLWSDEVYRIHELPIGQKPPLEDAINFYIDEDRSIITDTFNHAIATGEGWDLELRIRTAKGNEKWVRTIGTPQLNADGKVISVKGVFQDIQSKKLKELELRQTMNTVDDQNKRLLNFAHIVSHNLRSHTGNIEMILNLLNEPGSKDDISLYLDNLGKVSKNLSETISHLNEIVSIQTQSHLKKEVLHFDRMLNITKETLFSEIETNDIEITSDFSECPVVEFVSAYLDSIVLNLVSNAIKYRSPDRPCKIHLHTSITDGRIQLHVADNGLGINLEQHGDRMFGMYKTFHRNENARGIGLFITKNQVESQGGLIEVSSEVDKGSTFTITF